MRLTLSTCVGSPLTQVRRRAKSKVETQIQWGQNWAKDAGSEEAMNLTTMVMPWASVGMPRADDAADPSLRVYGCVWQDAKPPPFVEMVPENIRPPSSAEEREEELWPPMTTSFTGSLV